MQDLTQKHDEDPEEHKGRFLDADEIIDPDEENDDGTSADDSPNASTE